MAEHCGHKFGHYLTYSDKRFVDNLSIAIFSSIGSIENLVNLTILKIVKKLAIFALFGCIVTKAAL